MRKHIELKRFNQGTALTTGTLALPALVIEGLAEFNGSFERLCLKAGTAAIEAMLAADAEQFCGKRYQRNCRLLRARRERPTCHAAEQRYEVVPVHQSPRPSAVTLAGHQT